MEVYAHEFYTLLSSIYKYQDESLTFIYGDFDSRCSDKADYTVGVDKIPERDVVDFSCKWYGEVLIDFLINENYCVLNERKFVKNDFTSVSGRGSAVVDYRIVSHDSLPAFDNFNVIRTCDQVDRVIAERGLYPSSFLIIQFQPGLKQWWKRASKLYGSWGL